MERDENNRASPLTGTASGDVKFILGLIGIYDEEDLRAAAAPYMTMLEAGVTPDEKESVLGALTARAKELGLSLDRKYFRNRLRAYERDLKHPGDRLSAVTDLDIGRRFLCDGYEVSMEGVWKKGGQEQTCVCPHPIFPVARETNLETGEESLVLWFQRGEVPEAVSVNKGTIASAQKILSLAPKGITVSASTARHLSDFLMRMEALNGEQIVKSESTSRLGWTRDFKRFVPFRLSEKELPVEYDGEDAMRRRFQAVSGKGELTEWVKAVKPLRDGCFPFRLLLAASFASPLLRPLGAQPFFVHLWGRTGLGKTVALQVAASVWADPAPGRYMTSYNATAVGLEYTAAFLRDLPLCVDELMIRSAESQRDFSSLIYTLGEGAGKTRGDKDGGLRRQNTWSLCVLSTGERPLSADSANGGAMNRVLDVELETPVTDDFSALMAAIAENRGRAGEAYLKAINARGFDKLREQLPVFTSALVRQGITGKQAAAGALLLMADALAGKFVFGDEKAGLTPESLVPYLMQEADINPEEKALEAFFAELAANPGKIKGFEDSAYEREFWGKKLDPEPLSGGKTYVAVIGTRFDSIIKNVGGDPTAVLRYAERKGILKRGKGNRMRIIHRIGCIQTSCVVLQLPEEEESW